MNVQNNIDVYIFICLYIERDLYIDLLYIRIYKGASGLAQCVSQLKYYMYKNKTSLTGKRSFANLHTLKILFTNC